MLGRYVGSAAGGITPTPTAFGLAAAPEGGWSWFADPRAINYNGKTYWGYTNRDGDVTARSTTDSTQVTNTLISGNRLYPAMQIDDHDNPALVVRNSDKKLLYFYTRHSGTQFYLSVSSAAEDISAFAARVDLASSLVRVTGFTYPNPVQLTSETNEPIWLFYRDPVNSSTTTMRYSKSTDGGATWAAHSTLFETASRSSYWKVATNGTDRIDFAASDGHPMYDPNVSIYHWYYKSGNIYKTDGTLIGAIGTATLTPSDVTLVYSGATTTSWIWDVFFDGTNPYVTYTTYPGNDGSDHRANYARWTGSAWDTHEVDAIGTYVPTAIASGGSQLEVFYSGGVILDRSDHNVVYIAKGLGGGRWDIYRCVTANGGTTWTKTALTSSGKNIRPVGVRNYDDKLQVMWMSGTYASYTSFNVASVGAGS